MSTAQNPDTQGVVAKPPQKPITAQDVEDALNAAFRAVLWRDDKDARKGRV